MENKFNVNDLKHTLFNELQVIKHKFENLRKRYFELKSCCNANAEAVTDQAIEKRVEKILSDYLPGISKSDFTFQNGKGSI